MRYTETQGKSVLISLIIKIIKELEDNIREELRKKMQEVKDHFNEEIQILKRNQTELLEMKEMINQVKISLESITNRLNCKENRNSVLEDRTSGIEDKL